MKSTRIIGTVLCTLAVALVAGCNNSNKTAANNGTAANTTATETSFDQPFFAHIAPGDRGDR
jgi:hypothetical protein